MEDIIKIRKPDDWHLHLRDGNVLNDTVYHSSLQFARAIVMPNLQNPVVSVSQAADYRQRILDSIPSAVQFNPLMTLYLTDNTSVEEAIKAANSDIIHGMETVFREWILYSGNEDFIHGMETLFME